MLGSAGSLPENRKPSQCAASTGCPATATHGSRCSLPGLTVLVGQIPVLGWIVIDHASVVACRVFVGRDVFVVEGRIIACTGAGPGPGAVFAPRSWADDDEPRGDPALPGVPRANGQDLSFLTRRPLACLVERVVRIRTLAFSALRMRKT